MNFKFFEYIDEEKDKKCLGIHCNDFYLTDSLEKILKKYKHITFDDYGACYFINGHNNYIYYRNDNIFNVMWLLWWETKFNDF